MKLVFSFGGIGGGINRPWIGSTYTHIKAHPQVLYLLTCAQPMHNAPNWEIGDLPFSEAMRESFSMHLCTLIS